jgi:hypothetical protein
VNGDGLPCSATNETESETAARQYASPYVERALLAEAKVRDGRLRDASHTAATVLLILGVPERAVMGLMGWSTTAMAARYQHMVDAVRPDIARQVDNLIWNSDGSAGAGSASS